jgi:hypothetical protein
VGESVNEIPAEYIQNDLKGWLINNTGLAKNGLKEREVYDRG